MEAPFPVLSGVPQGSNLGLHLSTFFISDIQKAISTKLLLLEDDIKEFTGISSQLDQEVLHSTLDIIRNWWVLNAVDLNISLCEAMFFSSSKNCLSFDCNINGINLKVSQ